MPQDSTGRFDALTDRQRTILRYVARNFTSAEISRETGWSPDAIDKQCKLAATKLGCPGDRRRAARLLEAHEAGVQLSDPPVDGPTRRPIFPLPLPVPTASRPINDMDWRQVLLWGAIIAIAAPLLATVGAMFLTEIDHLAAGLQH